MTKFVKLHGVDEQVIWVNVARVVKMVVIPGDCTTLYADGQYLESVKETPEQIGEMVGMGDMDQVFEV
jgi:hypothetical protein